MSEESSSDNFRVISEKHLGHYIDDVSGVDDLIDRVNNVQKQKNIIISGFPFDEGTFLSGGRIGAEKAPQVFRRVVQEERFRVCNTTFGNLFGIYDIGDVSKKKREEDDDEDAEQKQQEQQAQGQLVEKQGRYTEISLEEAHLQQRSRIGITLDALLHSSQAAQSKNVFFIVGGSGDMSYPNAIGLSDANPDAKIGVISIDSLLDVKPLLNKRTNSRSQFLQLLESSRVHKFIAFGASATRASKADVDLVENSKVGSIVWMESNIRREKQSIGINEVADAPKQMTTQAGLVFQRVLSELEQSVDIIFVSLDMQSINAAYAPGVSYPSVTGGLSESEILEIAKQVGTSKKVAMFDVSEFSPAVESKRTSRLLANIFFEFVSSS